MMVEYIVARLFRDARMDCYYGSVKGLQKMISFLYGLEVSPFAVVHSLSHITDQYRIVLVSNKMAAGPRIIINRRYDI